RDRGPGRSKGCTSRCRRGRSSGGDCSETASFRAFCRTGALRYPRIGRRTTIGHPPRDSPRWPQPLEELPMASVDRKGLLAQYREPHAGKSVWQLASTVLLLCGMWGLMWYSLRYSYAVTLLLSLPAAGLLVRLFILQHDC